MRTYITLLFFVVIAAASYWLLDDITEQNSETKQANKHFPDYFLENFSITSMNPQGLPQYTLSAKKMLHYADDDKAKLEQPFLSMATDNNEITLKASRGDFLKKENLIYLHGDIVIHRKPSAKQSELFIYTDYLKINTQSQIVETHLAARIETDDAQINTTGLIFNNQQGTLKLNSNVKVKYEAPK